MRSSCWISPTVLRTFAAAAWICSLPIAAVAQSGVTVYGLVDATVRATNVSGGGRRLVTVVDGAFTGSRLGFRVVEDLGDGLKAILSLEQGFDPSTGQLMQVSTSSNYGQTAAPAGRAFGREAYVGLQLAQAGSLTLGRQYTLANVFSSRFQPNANPNQEVLALLVGHQLIRQDNMVKYAVGFGAFSFAASKTLGEQTNGPSWSAAAGFKQGIVDLAAYTANLDSTDGTETRRIRAAGGALDVTSSLRAYLGVMKRTHRVSEQNNTVVVGALSHAEGSFVYCASYGEDRQRAVAAGKRKLGWVSMDYLLSKRTDIYAVVDMTRLEGAYPLPTFMSTRGTLRGAQVGVRHRF